MHILHECILSLKDTSPCGARLKECVVERISACFSEFSLAQLGQWLNDRSFAAFRSPTTHQLLNLMVNRTMEPLGSMLAFCAEVQAALPETKAELPAALQ
jgi:hypothetical protein